MAQALLALLLDSTDDRLSGDQLANCPSQICTTGRKHFVALLAQHGKTGPNKIEIRFFDDNNKNKL